MSMHKVIGTLSLIADGALLLVLYARTDLGIPFAESLFVLLIVPAVFIYFTAHHFARLVRLGARPDISSINRARITALLVIAAICGPGGLWLAIAAGPHLSASVAAFGLMAQLLLTCLARFKFATSDASTSA